MKQMVTEEDYAEEAARKRRFQASLTEEQREAQRARWRELKRQRRANDSEQRKRDAARRLVRVALRAGHLTKPGACEWCGATSKLEGSHAHDYSDPLEVLWLCLPCHRRRDRGTRASPHQE